MQRGESLSEFIFLYSYFSVLPELKSQEFILWLRIYCKSHRLCQDLHTFQFLKSPSENPEPVFFLEGTWFPSSTKSVLLFTFAPWVTSQDFSINCNFILEKLLWVICLQCLFFSSPEKPHGRKIIYFSILALNLFSFCLVWWNAISRYFEVNTSDDVYLEYSKNNIWWSHSFLSHMQVLIQQSDVWCVKLARVSLSSRSGKLIVTVHCLESCK